MAYRTSRPPTMRDRIMACAARPEAEVYGELERAAEGLARKLDAARVCIIDRRGEVATQRLEEAIDSAHALVESIWLAGCADQERENREKGVTR